MASVRFDKRLVFDRSFLAAVLSGTIPSRPGVLRKLMSINDRASGYSRTFCIMSKRSFTDTLTHFPGGGDALAKRTLLRAAVYDCEDDPAIEAISDEKERTIKLAIDILEPDLSSAIIITTEAELNSYRRNPHLVGVNEVSVLAGEEALAVIDDYFQKCTFRD